MTPTPDDKAAARPLKSGVHTVFCDESGFTGSNLLDRSQPIFVYSAVAIEPAEASELLTTLHRKFGLPGTEMKASELVRTPAGREFLSAVIRQVSDRSVVSVHDKTFAIAAKFFEYVFEPILSDNSGFFYSIGFHKFVSNLLYVALATKTASAEIAVAAFQNFINTRRSADLHAFLAMDIGGVADPWRILSDFAKAYPEKIDAELTTLRSIGAAGRWALELSSTSMMQLLSVLGRRYEKLNVYCDESQPLRDGAGLINASVGVDTRAELTIGRKTVDIGFCLTQPIQHVDSKLHPGIQIADCIATTVNWALRGADGGMRPEARADLRPILDITIYPLKAEPELIDFRQKDVALNTLLLLELQERAKEGRDPLEGIVETYYRLREAYDRNPPAFSRKPITTAVKVGRNALCPCDSGRKYKRCCGVGS